MALQRMKKVLKKAFPFLSHDSAPVLDDSPYGRLLEKIPDFKRKLNAIKTSTTFDDKNLFWHPYDSLSNLYEIGEILSGQNYDLLSLAGGYAVADIGAADGDLAFFLESCGIKNIHVIEYGPTSCNRLQGVRLLAKALNSSVAVHEINLDAFFELPKEQWGLVFLLGTLYHLKNPFYVLELLADNSRYCCLSTRIARFGPDRKTLLARLPVAYLLDEEECNNDVTNYWVFADAGLRRILKRSGWDILCYKAVGSNRSTPASMSDMERVFCLLKSRKNTK